MEREDQQLQLMNDTQILVAYEAVKTFFDSEGACIFCGHGSWDAPEAGEPCHQLSYDGDQLWRLMCRQCMPGQLAVCWKRPGSAETGDTFELKLPDGIQIIVREDYE